MKLTLPQYAVLTVIDKPVTVRDLTTRIKKTAKKNPYFDKARVNWSNHRAAYNYIYRILVELSEAGLVECNRNRSTHVWELVAGIEIEAPLLQEELTFETLPSTKDPRTLLLEAQRLIQEAMSQLSVIDKLREIFK